MINYPRMAAHNLMQARKRTTLLAVALAFVSLLLTMLLALSQGLSDTMVDNLTTLSTGHVNVVGWNKIRATSSSPLIADAGPVREILRKTVPEAQHVSERLMGWAKVVGERNSVTAELAGVDVAQEPFLVANLSLAPEKEYAEGGSAEPRGSLQGLAEPGTLALFSSQAKRMGVRVGDSVTLAAETAGGAQNVLELRVAAVVQNRGVMTNFLVLVNRESVRQLYNLKPESVGEFLVYLNNPAQSNAVMDRLRKALDDA